MLSLTATAPPSEELSRAQLICIDMAGAALIIVDVQHDFIDGSLAIPRAADVLPVIAELAEAAWGWEVVVVSQDYHPVGHLSFASSHGAEPFTSAVIKGKGDRDYKQMLWPDHCVHWWTTWASNRLTVGQVQGTRGAELHPDIAKAVAPWRKAKTVLVAQKGIDREVEAFSAFDAVCTPSLTEQLRARHVQRLVVCGLATDYCVKQTVLSGLKSFDVVVVSDAVKGVASTSDALSEMERAGARVMSIGELAASCAV